MFKTLSHLPEFPARCVEEALRAKYEVSYKPNQIKAPSSFNNTKFVKLLQSKFGRCGGVYMKNTPMTLYDWHIDIGRKCSLNWVLKNNNATTLYRRHIAGDNGEKSLQYAIEEVMYELYKPTLLNVLEEHCVVNNTNEERIIFSLSIDAPYEEVSEFLSNLNITNY
jgi:hypothetical protein